MSKTITMYAAVAFDYRGAKIQPGQPFEPHSAVDAARLKTQKKADFRKPASPRPAARPLPASSSRELETSTLTSEDGGSPQQDARRGAPRGQYRRRDMRAEQ